jgi:membrane-associated phospholipid phosphatase
VTRLPPNPHPSPPPEYREREKTAKTRSYIYAWMLLWAMLLCAAFFVDRSVATWVHETTPLDKHFRSIRALIFLIRIPGDFRFAVAIAIVLAIVHPQRIWAAAALFASGMATGINPVIKWITGRHRPIKGIYPFEFHPFPQGFVGLWKEQALCFPSGDTTHAFAAAASLSILFPRWKWFFYFVALLVAVERVLENAHYVSDVVAGAGLGTVLGLLITRLILRHAKLPPADLRT